MNKRLVISSAVVLGAVLFAIVFTSRREPAAADTTPPADPVRQGTAQTGADSTPVAQKTVAPSAASPASTDPRVAQPAASVLPASPPASTAGAGQTAVTPAALPTATPRTAAANARPGTPSVAGATPVSTEPMAFPGLPVTARVTSGERAFDLVPDQVGTLQLHEPLPLKSAVEIEVAYPTGDDNARVVAVVEDGGQLADGKRVLPLQLNANRKVSFRFSTTDAQGIYRITLRCGVDVKTIQLWGGDPLPAAGS